MDNYFTVDKPTLAILTVSSITVAFPVIAMRMSLRSKCFELLVVAAC
jgi:hypothetical protein